MPPGRSQFDAAGRSGEELTSSLALQLADLLGEWRLGDVQALRGAAEVQFLGDGTEIPQMAQLHD